MTIRKKIRKKPFEKKIKKKSLEMEYRKCPIVSYI